MQQLHYCLGLPRTCSTVMMNILNQNPRIFTTGTCCMPYFIDACQKRSNEAVEFMTLKKDVLNNAYLSFLREGIRGWFESMTNKPIVFSKHRVWGEFLPTTFAINPESKYLVLLRDLRDIVCSFDSLSWKYPNVNYVCPDGENIVHKSMDDRMKHYCSEVDSILARPLSMLPHICEVSLKNPNKFLFVRQEDFNINPKQILRQIYKWLGEDYFDHDLEQISHSDYYEHDTIYRSLVSHKVRNKLEKIEPRWTKVMSKEESNNIIENNRWYYDTFYGDFL